MTTLTVILQTIIFTAGVIMLSRLEKTVDLHLKIIKLQRQRAELLQQQIDNLNKQCNALFSEMQAKAYDIQIIEAFFQLTGIAVNDQDFETFKSEKKYNRK